jgi:alanine dehydrogenase
MRIGVPKESKAQEFRVGLIPAAIRELTVAGHEVSVETGAGEGIGLSDDDYRAAGAGICADTPSAFDADLIVKVKEPQADECALLGRGQVLFTYLHLAADPEQAKALCASGVTAIAYETVTADDGSLPLLTPMSEVAGRLSVQVGATSLQKANGGSGVLLGGVPGVSPARVVILGGGVAGTNAAEIAVGMRAHVTVVDRSQKRLRELSSQFGHAIQTVYSTTEAVESLVLEADLVIGAVLVVGATAPRLVTRDQVRRMKAGAVLVDISIDQGGCFETSRATTHGDPTFVVDDVVHYCVANMPGAVPRTSTAALGNVTLPFVRALADKGWEKAMADDRHLANGLNVHAGGITYRPVARDLGLELREHPVAPEMPAPRRASTPRADHRARSATRCVRVCSGGNKQRGCP